MHTGLFIVFEGIDGTGKSTQLSLLATALRQQGREVVETREPTEGAFGQQIRALYRNRNGVSREQELELFIADRREHVRNLLTPALQEGKIVLCDRYFLSTAAYQGAAGLSPPDILAANSFAPSPDLALLFCASPQTGIQRITEKRGEQLNDFEQAATLHKVAAIFDSLDFPYIRRIDASASIASVHQAVLEAVLPFLHRQNHDT